jgi:hypothetical protein
MKSPEHINRITRQAVAINQSARRAIERLLVGIASNVADTAPITDETDGWLRLAPYGQIPYWKEDGVGWKKFSQIFEKPQADAMAAAFNALAAKKGASFKGLPIYNGHPDADPERWPDERRYGGIMGVEARADGLYVRAAWNALGEENRKEGYLVYPSPAWLYDFKAARRTGNIVPEELRSVGLTNSPRIQDSIPWVNSVDPGAPDEEGDSQFDSNNPPAPALMLDHKKMLTGLLGLKEDASDGDIAAAHAKHMDVIEAKTKLDTAHTALQKAHEKLQRASEGRAAALDAMRKTAAGALLDCAVNAGRVSAAERTEFEGAFATNFDEAATRLAGKKPALNTRSLDLKQLDGSDLSTPALRAYAYNCRAGELRSAQSLKTEDDVVAAMRADEKGKTILAAMHAASTAR